jgi:enoyl-CoA hydratase
MVCRLAELWREVEADDRVRVAILTGAGDKAFSAGADLKLLIPLLAGSRQPADAWDERVLADRGLIDCALLKTAVPDKPVIAALNGVALAGGALLALGTDLRVAASTAAIGITEVQRGLLPGGGGIVYLPRQIPHAIAMEMLLTGEAIGAERAYALGLVNRVVAPDRLLAETESLAARIAANGPLAVRAIKRAVRTTSGFDFERAMATEHAASQTILATADAAEGARAFLEKRPPHFVGR